MQPFHNFVDSILVRSRFRQRSYILLIYNNNKQHFAMAPRSRKAPPTLKTASKAPQVKLPEKHHWYFDKQNVGSKEYGEIVNAFFPDGEAISDMVRMLSSFIVSRR